MTRIKPKHPLIVRMAHWLNFPVLGVMVWSGMLIYWSNDVYEIKWHHKTVFHFFPDGFYNFFHFAHRLAEGMSWHFTFMWLFMLNGIIYVVYTILSGEWRYLVPGKHALKEAFLVVLHDLYIYRKPLPKRKFNAAQQIAYTCIIVMGILSVLTGWAIYKPVQVKWLTFIMGGYETARIIHFILTLGYVLFFVIHILQVIRAGWKNYSAMVTGTES